MTRQAPRRADDIDAIMAVMATAFPAQFGEAWTRGQLEAALLSPLITYALIDATGQVPPAGEPAGFALVRTVCNEAELLLLAIAPPEQRRGLARRLLTRLIAELAAAGVARLVLEVRRGNPAEGLYRAHGCQPIGERPRYYRGAGNTHYDALTFALRLGADLAD